ncbi:MAG TPA: phosphatase PAP2 family protein [Jiangellaceae bacterium]|nr:phosphatase PAP2 family protein [Jiangellaceae bacterium]
MTREEWATPRSTWTTIQPWMGRAGLAAYLAVLVNYILRDGLPTHRIDQTIWILAGIVAAKLGRNWRVHVRAIVDWLPLLGALMLYDFTRGIADTLGMPLRVAELVDAERFLFGGHLPTVWLQERFYTPGDPQWWDVVASAVYFSHFVVPWALAAAFYVVSRPLWWRYIRIVLLLSYTGLLTYILVPAAPPWYAAWSGTIDENVERNIGSGWSVIGLRFASAWFNDVRADANMVAALPSLHAAFALLVCVGLWPVVRHWFPRVLLVAFPVAMGMTLVYSGEHYVVDVLLGFAYVGLIVLALRLWDRWRHQRRASEESVLEASVEPADLPEQVASLGKVGWPYQQPVPAGSLGDGVPDAGVEKNVLNGAQVVGGDSFGDGFKQSIFPTTFDQRIPLPKRPTRNQD